MQVSLHQGVIAMFYYLLALLSGAAVATQAGVNGKLMNALGSPLLTSLISFLIGTLGLCLAYALSAAVGWQPVPAWQTALQTSPWMWLGGLLGALYIFTTILCLPQIGFAAMFSLFVSGQLLLALIFDHFALLGSPLHALTPLRLMGGLLVIAGVWIIQKY